MEQDGRGPTGAVDAAWVLGRFTSLGDNCEFGLAQRRGGAEPLGLLRFASCELDGLLAGLADGFADLDPPRRLTVSQPWGEEFITHFGDHGFYHHTVLGPREVSAEALRRREGARVPFLRRRMMDDLAGNETIFVRKSAIHDPQGMIALHRSLGGCRLLWVEEADTRGEAMRVVAVGEGLYYGRLERFADYGNAVALDFDGWLRLCLLVLEKEGVCVPPARAPAALRIGVDAPMTGWDGVEFMRGAPVAPLRPEGQVFTHASDAARSCCGAVLNPRPVLMAGEAVVASVYVWLPCEFRGRLVAPVLTHVERAQRLVAVLEERLRWQRLWVAAVIPEGLTGVDFALWVELDDGDVFYSTEWQVERRSSVGAYLLAGEGLRSAEIIEPIR